MGMRLKDFEACTPCEFDKIYKSWLEKQETDLHTGWEQARMLATIIIQAHSSSRIKITDVMRFPWDKEENGKEDVEKSTSKRFEEMKKKAGLE